VCIFSLLLRLAHAASLTSHSTPRSLFFKEEMELSLIGLNAAGKTSLVNVLAVRIWALHWACWGARTALQAELCVRARAHLWSARMVSETAPRCCFSVPRRVPSART